MKGKKLCFKCRIEQDYKRRDNGAHTARKQECESCKVVTGILPERHWVKLTSKG